MFCRYCGASIVEDSLFCAKCGRRLGKKEHPRLNKVVQALRLKTPYPYFAFLLIGYLIWAIGPRQSHADFSNLKLSIELDRELDVPEQNTYQQSLSLVVENAGQTAVREVPVELTAKIEPAKSADIITGFLGRRLMIMRQGRPLPLVLVLANDLEPGHKKRFLLEGSIQAVPPFKVTYEVRQEDQTEALASFVVNK